MKLSPHSSFRLCSHSGHSGRSTTFASKFLCAFPLAGLGALALFFGASSLFPAQDSYAKDKAYTEVEVKLKNTIQFAITGADYDSATKTVTAPAFTMHDSTLHTTALNIDISTNNAKGYSLYMFSYDNTYLENTERPTITIPTLDKDYAVADFPTDHWGYSLDATTYHPMLKYYDTLYDDFYCTNDDEKYNTPECGNSANTAIAPITITSAAANHSYTNVTFGINAATAVGDNYGYPNYYNAVGFLAMTNV